MKKPNYLTLLMLLVSIRLGIFAVNPVHLVISSGSKCVITGNTVMTVTGNLSNSGSFAASGTSNVKFTGTIMQNIGGTGTTQFQNAEMNNTANFKLSGDISINTMLLLSAGTITLGNFNLTIGSSAGIFGSFGTSNMIIADATGGNTGQLKKIFTTGATNFTFPVGDMTAATDYSPVVLNITANSADRTIGIKVTDLKHPDDLSADNYISRYWSFTDDLCTGTYTYNASFSYSTNPPSDLVGTYNLLNVFWWNGQWNKLTTSNPVAPVLVISGINQTTGSLCGTQYTAREGVCDVKPDITYFSPDKIKCVRDTALFRVIASEGGLSYKWFKDGVEIAGETDRDYMIPTILKSDEGNYSCIVSNPCGESTTTASTLKIVSTLVLNSIIPNSSECEGKNITFTADAAGGELSYQWTRASIGNIPGANNSSYTITNIKQSDGDVYSCIISNTCGTKNLPNFIFSVDQKPVINISPITQTKYVGQSISYSLSPGGSSTFSYKWSKNNEEIDGATNAAFEIAYLQLSDAGNYTCVVSNSCGSTSVDAGTLIVLDNGGTTASGILVYDNKPKTPMNNTKVFLETIGGERLDSTTTDVNGAYTLYNLTDGEYRLDGKTIKEWGGVDPVDALMTNKFYIGTSTFADNLKAKAADVNKDNKVNPQDALLINKRYIGTVTKFPAGDWLFRKDTITVAGNIVHDFQSICYGDVNGTYIPPNTKLLPDIFIVREGEIQSQPDKLVEIPIKVTNDIELGAIGLKLKVSSQVIGIKTNIDGMMSRITEDGVNIAWSALNGPVKLQANETMFSLILNATSCNVEVLPYSILSGYNAERISGENLSIPQITLLTSEENSLKQNYPNPFDNTTTIEYTLGQASQANLSIFNVLGEKVKDIINSIQDKGTYKVNIDCSDLPAGLYSYRLETISISGIFSQTKLMVIEK